MNPSIYVGGVYDFEIGKAYMSYCESASNYVGEYFTDGGISPTHNYATANYNAKGTKARNCYTDKKLNINLAQYMPASIT